MERRVKQLLSLACAGVFTLAVAGSVSAQNLLYDPNFDQELTAPNPNPNGVQGWATFGGANFLATTTALSAPNVMYTPDNGGGYSVPGAYEVFTCTAGQVFTFNGWIYTPNNLPTLGNDFAILQLSFFTGAAPNNYGGGTGLSVYGVDVGQPAGGGGVPLPQGTWTFASITGTALNQGLNHVNSVGVYLLDINADANADFYFDNMALSVPEPSTIALVLASMAGGILFIRKRRS